LDTPSMTRAKNFQHKWKQTQDAVTKAQRELVKAEERFKQLVLEAAVDNRDLLRRNDVEMAWLWHHLINSCGDGGIGNEEMLKAVGMTADEIRESVFR
jgi:hypothetical protein